MARPLRVDVENGWYLVTARGIERRTIFYDDRYCEHFCELLAEMSERYSLGVHAHVLLGNHYHLILRTPNANLSRAMQWLNVSFSAWFNAKRNRVGHVFQGRFGSRLIDGDGSWLINASVTDRLIIGGTAFVEEMKSKIRVVSTEHPHRRWLQPKVSMSEIVRAVEGVKGEKWEEFRNRRGDWGKPMVLYLARKRSGCSLRELGEWLGGTEYKTVSKTVERFAGKLARDKKLARCVKRCIATLSTVET